MWLEKLTGFDLSHFSSIPWTVYHSVLVAVWIFPVCDFRFKEKNLRETRSQSSLSPLLQIMAKAMRAMRKGMKKAAAAPAPKAMRRAMKAK